MKRAVALRRELPASSRIPYRTHVTPHLVRTEAGEYVQVFRLAGASFECMDDEVLNNWHERLNVLWRNIAGANTALWSHVARRRNVVATSSHGDMRFAASLAAKYGQRLSAEILMVNDLYLSIVYRPVAGAAPGLLSRFASKHAPAALAAERADAIEASEKLAETLSSSLGRYEPARLQTYVDAEGRQYSQVLEFLSLLLNGESKPVPLPRAPIHQVLAISRVIFGSETIEYRLPEHTRFGAILGIKEYATPTSVGMFNALLSAPFEFVLTQSFAFLSKGAGQGLLQRQHAQMSNAGDFAVSQAEELKDALDALTANEFVMGDHHFTLQILTGLDARRGDGPDIRLRKLNDDVAIARSMLADTGLTTAREDLALEAAYWAQLPACFSLRPRKAPITSRNFCAKTGFHNFPGGRATGNHWGDALALLITSARSPYHFSLHASDPRDPNGGSRKDTGHTFICGPTGCGKSVLIGFLAAMLSRQGVTQVIFDKDRGLEILVRALGGTYLSLRNGEPTGFNPLQLDSTPQNVEFLKGWLRALVRGPVPLSAREQADLDHALVGVLAIEPAARRLSRLIEFTDATRSEGIHARLSRWCECTGGDYAWVFDNPADSLVGQLSGTTIFGIDVTEFLDHPLTRDPITLYLFHVVRSLLDGRRFVCWMDEFWRLLADPAFESFAKDGPKTWRKLNAIIAVATQSASDVLASGISRTIIEQTPTKIFFPNPDASPAEYIEGFGLSEREFRLIKEQLEPGSRRFLVKQGHYSVVCGLDLKGFDAELKVISGRASTVEELYRLMARTGAEPERWLPEFMATSQEGSA